MVNSAPLPTAAVVVRVYLVVVAATLVALGIVSSVRPADSTDHAWGHAIAVTIFAILLPLRLRSAQHGRRGAIRAVGLIAAVLLLANLVEALLPGFVPGWMRVEMYAVAALMLVVVLDVVRWAVDDRQQ